MPRNKNPIKLAYPKKKREKENPNRKPNPKEEEEDVEALQRGKKSIT